MTVYSVLCSIFTLLVFSYIFPSWELPKIPWFDPLAIVFGYPSLIRTYYADLLNNTSPKTVELITSNVIGSRFRKSWNCDFETENLCVTRLEPAFCSNQSQFSSSFWANGKCNNTNCAPILLNGSTCINVVTKIEFWGSDVNLILEDVKIPTTIVQEKVNLRFTSSENCSQYSTGETIRSTGLDLKIKFGLNSTDYIQAPCSIPTFNATICNCDCAVPVLRFEKNETGCVSRIDFEIAHAEGVINGFAMRIWKSNMTHGTVRRNIIFLPTTDLVPKRNSEYRRHRFQCPSEVTCWAEILYPLSYIDHLEFHLQSILASILFFISIGLFRRNGDNK